MKLEFVINFGYQMLYSRRLYHPVYCWDGSIEASDPSAKMELDLLEYPFVWCSICYSPEKTRLSGNSWDNVITRRGVKGIQVTAECKENTVFTLRNQYGEFSFSADQLSGNERLVFPVGGKYGFCVITVSRYGQYWFRPGAFLPDMVRFEPGDMPLYCEERRRMIMAELPHGQKFSLPLAFEADPEKSSVLTLHIQAMLLKPDDPAVEVVDENREYGKRFDIFLSKVCQFNFIGREAVIRVEFDNGQVVEKTHYFRPHDFEVQMLEDVWVQIPVSGKVTSVTISQESGLCTLWIAGITARIRHIGHLEVEVPQWASTGREVFGRVYACKPVTVEINCGDFDVKKSLQTGWNEFAVVCSKAAVDQEVTVSDGEVCRRTVIPAVFDLPAESPEVMVGCDFTTVPHDDNGDMDQLLDYITRTKLGNTVVFRNFRPYPFSPNPSDGSLARWGKYCADHRIYVQSVNCHASGALPGAAGAYMHNGGWHEFAGTIYAVDPEPENPASDMREAMERFIGYVKNDVNKNRQSGFRYGYGDAGGGARYLFQAGLEYIRAETMVPHTQQLCSLVRPASRVYGKGDWGVHIAVQHSVQPHIETWHLGMYYLSLYQAWAMGASNLYEEDSLFISFKEEQQTWDDSVCKGKRRMTRDFYKFAATHPRKGELKIRIASLEGRYEAPFNGFICGAEQDPSYSVWGKHGSSAPEWGHRQPEKKHQLLDVLMPGASSHPLRQQEDKRRFYFSGTPYGDFDQLPVEASADEFKKYSLLLNLGWHTANDEDQAKISEFVADGGVYFSGITEYSMHTGREFLLDMTDLDLYNGGDLAEFAGIKVRNRGVEYSGEYAGISGDESSSRIYSFSPDEDGKCFLADIELCGAEVVVSDRKSGLPLIVKHRYGKGIVYTLTAWAYPGHEALGGVMAVWLRKLCAENCGEVFVEDNSKEVFWNVREAENFRQVILLNTDWTTPGNVKDVQLHTPSGTYPLSVREGEVKIVYLYDGKVIETNGEIHLEFSGNDVFAHSDKPCSITLHDVSGSREMLISPENSTVVKVTL